MTDIRMADVSEFQSNVNAGAYLGGGYKCLIVRTYNGYRPDHMMPGRRDSLRGYAFTALGWYAYLVDDRDAADQAHEFISTIGSLRANEFPILDLEAGSGDQTGRAQAWFNVVDKWAGFPAMLYSGDYFLRDQLSGAGHWGSRPLWIASYGSNEPSQSHDLWQFSDSYGFPGIGACDGNLYHDTADAFLALVRAGKGPAPAPTPTEDANLCTVVKADGRLETFVQDEDGQIWHAWQSAPNGGWAGSAPGKNASWASLGTPGG